MDEAEAIRRFYSGSEAEAAEAWRKLEGPIRRVVNGRLAGRWGIAELADRQDIEGETVYKILQSKGKVQFRSVDEFYGGLVVLNADQCCKDWLRKRKGSAAQQFPEGYDPEDDDSNDAQPQRDLGYDEILIGTTYHLADIVFLGLRLDLTREQHRQQLLAAQLHYFDGETPGRILRILGPDAATGRPLSRETLDDWLADPNVLRYMAFTELYYSNAMLAAHLLGIDEVDSRSRNVAIQRIRDQSDSTSEQKVILWRYWMGSPSEHILKRTECPFTREEMAEICDRCTARLPFKERRNELIGALGPDRGSEILRSTGLAERLAFQYRYHDELSIKDVCERLNQSLKTEEYGYQITLQMLNGWLCAGRLADKLKKHWAKLGEED